MIEYDKADVTSSYPSLTDYEIAVLLDKAYLALISQKVTGNNIRRATIESDIKSIADLSPLVTETIISVAGHSEDPANVSRGELPSDCEYFLSARVKQDYVGAQDNITPRDLSVKLLPYEAAVKFFVTPHNQPWVKTPVCYIKGDRIYIICDSIDGPSLINCYVSYIKTPEKFVDSVENDELEHIGFECSDTMAEELISLAITFALETVESTRLSTKLNTRGLEA